LYTNAVLLAAIEKLLTKGSLHARLDYEACDEDGLLECLSYVSPWKLDDSAGLARSFAEDAGLDIDVPVFEFADEIVSIADDVHRKLVAEWVASGDAVRTVSDTVRVAVRCGRDSFLGCGFVEPSLDKYGKFAFVPDEKLSDWVNSEGGVTSYRLIDWEDVVTTNPPTEADLALVNGQRRRREEEAARSAESRLRTDARLAVEKRRKACEVDLTQAEALWTELGLEDDIERALRVHNAILVKLTALEIMTQRKA
jgi:hypothetical protein